MTESPSRGLAARCAGLRCSLALFAPSRSGPRSTALIAHRFYGSDRGRIMVVDEWPDAESFQRFFESERSRIEPMMQGAGVTGEPEVVFWRKLDIHDDVGWEG